MNYMNFIFLQKNCKCAFANFQVPKSICRFFYLFFSFYVGALAVAVPGELKGYWEVYQQFGSLSWERLINPTLDICENGLVVTEYLANVIRQEADDILESESLRYVGTF